ncbi:MAG: hypothetical protein IJU26_01570 [Synergistaceae bacterium]|nr:hypothetical protein [Synergistaceae bacterium]
MNSVDDKQYVTLELHDAQIERLEALIERNLARQEAIAANIRTDIANLRGEMKAALRISKTTLRNFMQKLTAWRKHLIHALMGLWTLLR